MIDLCGSEMYGKDKEIIIVVKIIHKAIIEIFPVKSTFILLNPSMWLDKKPHLETKDVTLFCLFRSSARCNEGK
jgi:hypothetical protein